MSNRMTWFVLAATLAFAPAAYADEAKEDAQDEAFSQAVKDFGYAGGAAWQCGDEAARGKIEQQAMTSFNGLAQLFGTDEAFFFSAAFGAGTSAPIDKSECGSFVKHFEDGLKKGGVQ